MHFWWLTSHTINYKHKTGAINELPVNMTTLNIFTPYGVHAWLQFWYWCLFNTGDVRDPSMWRNVGKNISITPHKYEKGARSQRVVRNFNKQRDRNKEIPHSSISCYRHIYHCFHQDASWCQDNFVTVGHILFTGVKRNSQHRYDMCFRMIWAYICRLNNQILQLYNSTNLTVLLSDKYDYFRICL